MTFVNPFILDKNEYKREIDPVKQYIEQSAVYLQIQTNKTLEECKTIVINIIKNKTHPSIRDPKITYAERQANGDRVEKESTLNQYLKDSIQNKEIVAPTLTTYINPKEKESILVKWVEENKKARSRAKSAEFIAEAAKNILLKILKNIEQTNLKLSNNALSGAHVSKSTPLTNRTAHSTLTSTCRTTSAYGNANNEKIISGNRHYWSLDVVLNNIISIVSNTNYNELSDVIYKYNIHYPTINETLECIKYSTDLYWNNRDNDNKIIDLVSKLTDIQRAAFVYTCDFYHLKKHNPDLLRKFIKRISTKITTPVDNAINIVKTLPGDYLNLAHQICTHEMKGKGKDYKKMEGTPELGILVATTLNIMATFTEYKDLIKVFLVSDNIPASVAYFPDSIRRVAVTSDTDSTIFTVMGWVTWYRGSLIFDEESTAVSATMIFIASQAITHILAKMSANFGVNQDKLFDIAMKNEYAFDVFVVTQAAKHYFALISCQEGNVYEKFKTEIKGVHLKSSNAPLKIIEKATDMMKFIMNTVVKGEKIKILDILKQVADIERDIFKSIAQGSLDYFRLAQIKSPEAYTKEQDLSPYKHYLFWQEVFAPKYGTISPPIFTCIKVSTILDTPRATKEWLTNMKDKELAQRIQNWLIRNDRKVYPTMFISDEITNVLGIPPEILEAVDTRRMVRDLVNIYYIILESLGFFIPTDKKVRLVSDLY